MIGKKELENLFLKNNDGVFKPNFSFSSEDEENYYDFELLKTAEQVYQEWLENKDKIDICPPKTTEEHIAELYVKLDESKTANEALAQYVSDLEINLIIGGVA